MNGNEDEVNVNGIEDDAPVETDTGGSLSRKGVDGVTDTTGNEEIDVVTPEYEEPEDQSEDVINQSETSTILSGIAELKTLIEEKVEKGDKLRSINERLYDDLKKYQDGVVDAFIEEIFIDVIRIIRDTEDQVAHIPKECNEANYNSLFKKFSAIPLRLKDMLYEHDVEPFSLQDSRFDPKKQEISSTVTTKDPELKNTVKEPLAEGWLRHMSAGGESVEKIIRKERIIAYKYEEVKADE